VHEIRPYTLDIARDMHPHPAFVHFFEQYAQLQFSQTCTDAAVNAIAERNVTSRMRCTTG